MNTDIYAYNTDQIPQYKAICDVLREEIDTHLAGSESKVWHRHPVWFLDGNPVVGYGVLKNCVQLLFWSGQSFNEAGLDHEGTFKAAEKRYTSVEEINKEDLQRWLQKAKDIQWDYKNIVKRRGELIRLK